MNIEEISYYSNVAAFIGVMALWFVFLGSFFLRKRPKSPPDAKREQRSWIGLGLQGVGFAFVWAIQRWPYFSPMIDGQYVLGMLLSGIAILIAVASLWLALSAIRELGRQWSLTARLVEGHTLVTTGVYDYVRHPIYTAMLGMLLATGLVMSHWIGMIVAVIIFYIGTKIRTNLEEGLLRNQFGEEFESWKKRVPGLIPFSIK